MPPPDPASTEPTVPGPPSPRDVLQDRFGFRDFRPGQQRAIDALVAAGDALVVMPTGAGKSLCYQLPAVIRGGTTLVVSPLVALMKDQVDALRRRGIRAEAIHSGHDSDRRKEQLQALARGRLTLCYAAPERLRNRAFRSALDRADIRLIAVDEAHCISHWGHDFRPEYRRLADWIRGLGRPPVVAVTATATPRVRRDIARALQLDDPTVVQTGFDRPNLVLAARSVEGAAGRQEALAEFLDTRPVDDVGIIYCRSRRRSEEVAAFVRRRTGRSTVHYHAGLKGWERAAVQEDWMSGRAQIVVATTAFGMGVDRPDVRFVVHDGLPGSLEAWYQGAGRAGRDGQPAVSLVLHAPEDIELHTWFIEGSVPTLDQLRDLYGDLRAARRSAGRPVRVDADMLASWMGEEGPRQRGRVALRLLERCGLAQDVGGGRWTVRRPTDPPDVEAALEELRRHRSARRDLLAAMQRWAEMAGCRRTALLEYFGDEASRSPDPCCDRCDPAVARASGVQRTGGRASDGGEVRDAVGPAADGRRPGGSLAGMAADPTPTASVEDPDNIPFELACRIGPQGYGDPLVEDLARLRAWRAAVARALGVAAHAVAPERALRAAVAGRPEDVEQVAELPGVDRLSASRYGPGLLRVLHGRR